jgi:hypothetical protein
MQTDIWMAGTDCKYCLQLQESNQILHIQVRDVKQRLAKEKSIVKDLWSSK